MTDRITSRQYEWLVVLGSLAVCLLTAAHPVGATLDGALFSYFNNASTPKPLFYFDGWIPLLPDLVGYGIRSLPLPVQGVLYPGIALALSAWAQRELFKLLECLCRPLEAAALSFAALAYMVYAIPTFLLLSWSVWPCVIAAICCVLRKNIADEPYGIAGAVSAAFGAASNPTGVVLIPLLGVFAVWRPSLRLANIALSLALAIFFAAEVISKPHGLSYGPADVLHFLETTLHRRHAGFYPLIAALAGAAVLVFASWRDRALDLRRRIALAALAYVGLASLALFFLSSRLATLRDVPHRYSLVCIVTAIVGGALLLAAHATPRMRRGTVVLAFAAAVATSAAWAAIRLPTIARRNVEALRFFAAAQDFRATCSDAGIRLRAVIVLCRPLDLTRYGDAPYIRRAPFGSRFVDLSDILPWAAGTGRDFELLVPR